MTDAERKQRACERARAYRLANPEKVRARKRADYERHREARLAKSRAWKSANKEKHREQRKKYYEANRDRIRAKGKAQYAANRETVRKQKKAFYGLAFEAYERLWEQQGRCCALCPLELPLLDLNTHVDHCHVSGRVRGILCRRCNIRLGYLERRGEEGLLADFAYLGSR